MKLALSLVLTLAAGLQAAAMTIPEGNYKLEWKPVAASDSNRSRWYMCLQEAGAAEDRSFTGASSAKPLWAVTEYSLVVVDESKGTGTGYDIAYLVLDAPNSGAVDMKSAVRVELSPGYSNNLVSSMETPLMLNWAMGTPGAQVTRQMGVYVEVTRDRDEKGALVPSSVMVRTLGGWYGRVQTDAGPIRVETCDYDNNRIYNDRPSSDTHGDTVEIRTRKDWPGRTQLGHEILRQGVAGYFEGTLYQVNVSAAGDEVEFKRYTGETGRVKVSAVDPQGKQLMFSSLSLNGPAGSFSLDREDLAKVALPVGEYEVGLWVYPMAKPKKNGSPDNSFSLHVSPVSKLRIESGKTATVSVGGEIGVDLRMTGSEQESSLGGVSAFKKRSYVSTAVKLTMGGAPLNGGDADEHWRFDLTIRDAAGKVIRPAQRIRHFQGAEMEIGKDWRPGKYTAELKADLGAYQKPIIVKKQFLVTE